MTNCPNVTIIQYAVHLCSKVKKKKKKFHTWVLTEKSFGVLTDTVRFRKLRGVHLKYL